MSNAAVVEQRGDDAMRDPRTMLLDIDHSGLHSEPGSREWIITRRSLLVACLSDIKNNRTTGRTVFDEIQRHGGWEHLRDLKGKPFRSFAQFCTSANGLGLDRNEIERRLTAQEMAGAEGVLPLAKLGTNQHAEGVDNINSSKGGTSAAYLAARLKRDAPECAERLAAGEFPSARAAAIEAGIIKPPPPLIELRRIWKRTPEDQRAAFLAEIMDSAAAD
jgi:hypothetical protein